MRQVLSSGSIRAIYLDSNAMLQKVSHSAQKALEEFPEIIEIRLFGSFARGGQSSLSDVDILVIIEDNKEFSDPIEIAKPFFNFFSKSLGIATDVLVTTKSRYKELSHISNESKVIARR